jgi:outer membrane cobalamin receptor
MKLKVILFRTVIAFLMLFVARELPAQSTSTVSGVVKDGKSGKALVGASVYLKGTHTGGMTDDEGRYTMTSVPAGKWILVCSMLGYRRIEKDITIEGAADAVYNFDLANDELSFTEVVVTATRNEALVTSVPASTEVLSAKTIEESNAKNVGEALRTVGASFVKSYGAAGSLQTISLRGSTDAQVLVLIDGQRVNDAQSGSVDLSTIPLDAVERVEVVKGGNTAMYGSDAVGGVINIITKPMTRKHTLDFSAQGLYGTYNTKIYDLSVGQGISDFNYFASYNQTQSGGNYDYTNNAGEKVPFLNSDTKSDNAFFKAGYLFPDRSRLAAFFKYRYSNNGSPGSTDFPNTLARQRTRSNLYSITYDGLSFGAFAFSLNVYLADQESRYSDPQSYLGLEENKFNNRALGVLFQVFTDLAQYGLFSYGYEYRQDRLESRDFVNRVEVPYLGDHQRDINSVYFQDDWKYDFDHVWKLSIVPAARLDAYPEKSIGSQFSPKVGINLSHDQGWRGSVRANVGRVYRAPTYNDLYWPEDSWTKGNPNLKPERGTTFDFGFIFQFAGLGSWNIEETYFGSRMNDLILWAPAEKWMPENVARAKTDGLESKLGWMGFNNAVEIQAGYTYMIAKDDGNDPTTAGKYLIYRPKDKFDLSLNLNYLIASVNFYYNYVGKRFNDPQNTVALGGYSLFGANAGITPNWAGLDWMIRIEGNNLANKEIQIVDGSPVPGREVRLSIGISGSLLTGKE